jgi:hypothetical protein
MSGSFVNVNKSTVAPRPAGRSGRAFWPCGHTDEPAAIDPLPNATVLAAKAVHGQPILQHILEVLYGRCIAVIARSSARRRIRPVRVPLKRGKILDRPIQRLYIRHR